MKNEAVLVVDDDMVSLTMAQLALQDEYMLTLVKSGQQALAYLHSNTCDLILLDYEMPIMSGVEVLEKIRSNPQTKHIPVIFLTGNNDSKAIHTALALKPDGYLLKPINAEALRSRVAQIFS